LKHWNSLLEINDVDECQAHVMVDPFQVSVGEIKGKKAEARGLKIEIIRRNKLFTCHVLYRGNR